MSRKSSNLASYIDHTFLKPAGEKDAVRKLCAEAKKAKFASVCVNPCEVEACARMMEEWRPDPYPGWVTALPSRNNPTLVDDFARRLAGRLGLPYVPCLKKVADTPAQKDMQNSAFQQNNLLNAFGIEGEVPGGHCLLVDDMVDSRWTLTIAAALLRSAGVSSVTPLALADSSNGGE